MSGCRSEAGYAGPQCLEVRQCMAERAYLSGRIATVRGAAPHAPRRTFNPVPSTRGSTHLTAGPPLPKECYCVQCAGQTCGSYANPTCDDKWCTHGYFKVECPDDTPHLGPSPPDGGTGGCTPGNFCCCEKPGCK